MIRYTAICVLFALCFFSFLQTEVFATNTQTNIPQLTAQELQYLREKKTLKISVVSEWKPYSYQDKNGNFQGLSAAILKKLEQASGISVEYITAHSYSESLKQVAANEADLSAILMQYTHEAQGSLQNELMQIAPYLKSQIILISHKDTNLRALTSITLADIEGRADLTNKHNNILASYYPTQKECLTAVRGGLAEIAVCDSFTSAILMQQYNAKDFISTPTSLLTNFSFGALPSTDERLISSLEKAVASFTMLEINKSLELGSTSRITDYFQVVYRYPLEIICVCVALMFVMILSMHVYTKLRLRHRQSLLGYEESYRLLSDTFGEAGVEYDYINDHLTVFGKKSNLDIDKEVDDFHEKLRTNAIRLLLTSEQFDKILMDGVQGDSFSTEFQCGVKSGGWVWYRLIYTVICTTESHRRPIRLVGCLANIDAEQLEKERLMQLSSNDQLTGLFNRTTAEHLIRKRVEHENAITGIILLLDIDHFKKFNDKMGHFCGDDVLRSLGKHIKECFLDTDIQCRWGGDEFLLFIDDAPDDGEGLKARFDLLCTRMRGYTYKGLSCPVTLSAGGAKSYMGCTFESIFELADKALYKAKKNGRSQLCLSTFVKADNEKQTEVTLS